MISPRGRGAQLPAGALVFDGVGQAILQFFTVWGVPLLFDAHYARTPARDAVRPASGAP
jgi:hypothetical protein